MSLVEGNLVVTCCYGWQTSPSQHFIVILATGLMTDWNVSHSRVKNFHFAILSLTCFGVHPASYPTGTKGPPYPQGQHL
jgi:hypothetical protein